MVSQDIPSNNPTSSNNILHQFLIPDPTAAANQPQFDNNPPNFSAYVSSDLRPTNNNTFLELAEPLDGGANYHQSTTVQSLGERMSRSINLVHHEDHEVPPPHHDQMMGHMRRQQEAMDFLGAHHPHDHPNHPDQLNNSNRLSLSLGYQGRLFSSTPPDNIDQYRHQRTVNNSDLLTPPQQQEAYLVSTHEDDYTRFLGSGGTGFSNSSINQRPNSSAPPPPHGSEQFVNIVGSSRYLKPAQSLLEEVVSVNGKDVDLSELKRLCIGNMGSLSSSELRAEVTSLQQIDDDKQDLQIKLSKLISLLEEVESRYEEYCYRMEQLVSALEVLLGEGAAKIYTALALQAMSRHFSGLKNAILCQIRKVRKKLFPHKIKSTAGLLSQLSLFDGRETTTKHCSGTNRLGLHQQLGVVAGGQRRAWRPIKGLPETSVAILRAWLFEHFLHPYPMDSEKLILASQTGLTKNQVSNWFINARVRLWKPMIEEMYKDEFGDSSADSDSMFSTNSASREVQSDHGED